MFQYLYIKYPLVVYWSWHSPSERKNAIVNRTLGECFWAKDDQKPTTRSESCGLSTCRVPLTFIAYNWLVSWHVWSVRIRTGSCWSMGFGKSSLFGARCDSDVSSIKDQNLYINSPNESVIAASKSSIFLVEKLELLNFYENIKKDTHISTSVNF